MSAHAMQLACRQARQAGRQLQGRQGGKCRQPLLLVLSKAQRSSRMLALVHKCMGKVLAAINTTVAVYRRKARQRCFAAPVGPAHCCSLQARSCQSPRRAIQVLIY